MDPSQPTVTILAGGVGASRFTLALATLLPPDRITCVVNTADDLWRYGLRICPDIDTTLYTHGGHLDSDRGWGLRGDTFRIIERLRELGDDAWFGLGDLDLATHMLRTEWLRAGLSLSEVTHRLKQALGVRIRVFPMTESEVETYVQTDEAGWTHYQEFLVRRGAIERVTQFQTRGIENAVATPGVLEAIESADLVVIAPSNPPASILPMLSLPDVRQILQRRMDSVVAVTPVVSNVPIDDAGEAKRAQSRSTLLAAMGTDHDAVGVAGLYRDLAGVFVLDQADRDRAEEIQALGADVVIAPTLFHKGLAGKDTLCQILSRARPVAAKANP